LHTLAKCNGKVLSGQVGRNHRGDDRGSGTHLCGFFDLVERPHIPPDIDDPENEEDQKGKDERELSACCSIRAPENVCDPGHIPITTA
jgi:hypothetical protein